MSTRRSFFGQLFAAVVAPFIPIPKAAASGAVLGYKGREMFRRGIVYAPYIPLFTTKTIQPSDILCRRMSRDLAADIDKDMINRITILS